MAAGRAHASFAQVVPPVRIVSLVVVSMLLGVLIGVGSTWANLGGAAATKRMLLRAAPSAHQLSRGCQAPEGGPQPRLVVESEDFDFGIVESGTTVRHPFSIRNEGGYPLCIKVGGSSCGKCTVSEISNDRVPPGGETKVVVEYKSSTTESDFRQYVLLSTNDPERSDVTLTIFGKLAASLRVQPNPVIFTRVFPHQSQTAEVKLLAYLSDKLEVKNPEFTEPETAEFFEVKLEPLDKEQLKQAGGGHTPKSGYTLRIKTKPGLPSGVLRQTIRVRTNLLEPSIVEVGIVGKVVGNVQAKGPGWDEDHSLLDFGVVKSAQGMRRELQLVVHEPHPQDVQVAVESAAPKWLKVEIGKPSRDRERKLTLVPLSIEVPPGSPAANHLGNQLGKLARVVLHTNVPGSERFELRIRFAVEN